MQGKLGSFFNLYSFPTGRRMFAMGQVRERALKRGWQDIAGLCGEALAIDGRATTLERQWRGARQIVEGSRGEAAAIDVQLDRTVGALSSQFNVEVAAFADGERGAAAETLLENLFPDGVSPIVHATYENELAMVDEIVAAARTEFAEQIALLGVGHLIDLLASLADDFRAALGRIKTRQVTFDQVRAAHGLGQEAMLRVFAVVLGRFSSSSESDVAARRELLGPILKQNRRIGEYYSRRRSVPDVDAASGTELLDTAEEGTAAGDLAIEPR